METRAAPRVQINLKILSRIDDEAAQKFSLAKGNVFEIEAADISVGGIGIFSRYFLPKGLRIGLEIEGKPFGLDEPIKVKGEVRYCNYVKSSRYRCGVKFIDIPAKYVDKIAEFILLYEKRKEARLPLPKEGQK